MTKEQLKRWILHPSRFIPALITRFGSNLPDSLFLKLKFYETFGRKLNLTDPKTFNEKLQWLKLNDRNPEYTKMVDKIEAKRWAAERIGNQYIIPTLGVWEKAEDIDFDSLPEQFVLKTNHDSGGVVICIDKSKLDKAKAIKKLNNSLKRDFYKFWREYPYKNVKHLIFAEEFIPAPDYELSDYKFFCFDGEPKFLFVGTDRQKAGEEVKFDFFDLQFNHLPIRNGHDNAPNCPKKPANFEKMVKLASVLSKGIPHVRVDFYNVNGRILFGELTFYHFAGFVTFEPESWDYKFGEYINIERTKPQ